MTTRLVELRCQDPAFDTGEVVLSVNPAHVVWVADHPEQAGCALIRLTQDAFTALSPRANVVALLERGPRRA